LRPPSKFCRDGRTLRTASTEERSASEMLRRRGAAGTAKLAQWTRSPSPSHIPLFFLLIGSSTSFCERKRRTASIGSRTRSRTCVRRRQQVLEPFFKASRSFRTRGSSPTRASTRCPPRRRWRGSSSSLSTSRTTRFIARRIASDFSGRCTRCITRARSTTSRSPSGSRGSNRSSRRSSTCRSRCSASRRSCTSRRHHRHALPVLDPHPDHQAPRPARVIMNTPSHIACTTASTPSTRPELRGHLHRVDRLFGSYQREEREPTYGTVKVVPTWTR